MCIWWAGSSNRPPSRGSMHMLTAGSWSNNFDTEADWNMITPPMKGVNNRQVKLSRGRFLGGCSGCNGTLCIRGCKQDFDDWGLAGWSGEEFFHYMRKVSHITTIYIPIGMD